MNLPRVYTCSPFWSPSHLPPRTIPLGNPSAPAPSILYPALNLDWRFVSYMILYMFQCHSLKSSHPLPLPQSPKDCSIHLCLFCSLAYRVIVTVSLNLAIRSTWWATISPRSCFCWLYRTSPSLAAKKIINLIFILTILWYPCVRITSWVVGKVCLLWQACSLDKTQKRIYCCKLQCLQIKMH